MENAMRIMTLLSTLLLGHGCDTQEVPPAADCLIAETVGVEFATEIADLRPLLEENESLEQILGALSGYGLQSVTYTFAIEQVTVVWWPTTEAQDEARRALCTE